MKELGTPCHSFSFFKNIIKFLNEYCDIFILKYNSEIIGAALVFKYKRTAFSSVNISLSKFSNYSPNDYLYWKIINYYIHKGFKKFDFGRSSLGSGTHKYKKKWNGQHLEYSYHYHFNFSKSEVSYNSNDFKYILIKAFVKNSPNYILHFLNPYIRREIP